jgi:hypothetical protein
MAGFDPLPAELRANLDASARYKAVLRRLGELGVVNAVNRINASAPIEARDKVYRIRLRLIDMMTSRAREKGVRSLYDELTPSMREELERIQKIEVEAGTAPPESEPAIAAATTTAPTAAQPLPTPAGPWRARLVPRPRPLRTASWKLSRTLKPRQNDSRNHPPAASPAEPAIAPAPEQTLEVRTEAPPPPVLSAEAPEGPKPAPSKPRKRRKPNRVAAAHSAIRAIGAAWEKRILDHLADQALAKPDKADEWWLETVLPKQIDGLELHPESPNKSTRTLSLDMAREYLKRLRDKDGKRRRETKVRKKA